ncbi:hypothetical protein F2Q69_00016825 [Brassica cretica]|uniref:Uncharacterized protein n=1 Tax=Brassica cretica TaxID=69181 RepID=A0A8S9QLJ5_BRACR|nr:hypothetical protein F2Q69_00016825 [Brassica cretica]
MSRKELKPIASNRVRKRRSRGPGDREAVPEIAEQLRRSRGRLTVRKESRHEEGHIENPRESYTTLFSSQF